MARSRVLLPLPEGPSSTNSSPSSICAVTSLTAGKPAEILGNLLESDRHGVAASALDVGTRMLPGHGDKVGLKAVTGR